MLISRHVTVANKEVIRKFLYLFILFYLILLMHDNRTTCFNATYTTKCYKQNKNTPNNNLLHRAVILYSRFDTKSPLGKDLSGPEML